jgi:hypothetical protein
MTLEASLARLGKVLDDFLDDVQRSLETAKEAGQKAVEGDDDPPADVGPSDV